MYLHYLVTKEMKPLLFILDSSPFICMPSLLYVWEIWHRPILLGLYSLRECQISFGIFLPCGRTRRAYLRTNRKIWP